MLDPQSDGKIVVRAIVDRYDSVEDSTIIFLGQVCRKSVSVWTLQNILKMVALLSLPYCFRAAIA